MATKRKRKAARKPRAKSRGLGGSSDFHQRELASKLHALDTELDKKKSPSLKCKVVLQDFAAASRMLGAITANLKALDRPEKSSWEPAVRTAERRVDTFEKYVLDRCGRK